MVTKKSGYGRFLAKATLMLMAMFMASRHFTSCYRIGFDPQLIRCLPKQQFFLIDLRNQQMKPGKLYAFLARGTAPFFADGTWMIKRLVAVPGDIVTIVPENFHIQVNEKMIGTGLPLAAKLGYQPQHFCGKTRLVTGQYWFLGESQHSFDSRYWGVVRDAQIIGRAWALF